LHLKLEDAEHNRQSFIKELGIFMLKSFGIENPEKLSTDLENSFKPITTYITMVFQAFLVRKLAANLNYKLGYEVQTITA
jgi:hypothetical protein